MTFDRADVPDDPLASLPRHVLEEISEIFAAQHRYVEDHATTLPGWIRRDVLRGIEAGRRALEQALVAMAVDDRSPDDALAESFGQAERIFRASESDEEGYGVATISEIHRALAQVLSR